MTECLQPEMSHEETSLKNWSILDGSFDPETPFEKHVEIARLKQNRESLIKSRQKTAEGKGEAAELESELEKRIYHSDVLLHAIEHTNPYLSVLFAQADRPAKQHFMAEINEAVTTSLNLLDEDRSGSLKQIVEGDASNPMPAPEQIPVMQALRAMQEGNLIDYKTRTVLDGSVRILFIRQKV